MHGAVLQRCGCLALVVVWCLSTVGPFQSDALLVPEHCVFDHVHNSMTTMTTTMMVMMMMMMNSKKNETKKNKMKIN